MAFGEIIIVPFTDAGHTFPATQLATLLASRNYQITLFLPSIPSSPLHPLIRTLLCSPRRMGPPPPSSRGPHHGPPSADGPHHGPPSAGRPRRGPPQDSALNAQLTELITARDSSSPPLLCVIIDVMKAEVINVCKAHDISVACLFTASACPTSLELAPNSSVHNSNASLPLSVPATITGKRARPPGFDQGPPSRGGGGPSGTNFILSEDVIALLFNTCDALEKPYIDNIAQKANKPVFAVGPLLPEQFWSVVTESDSLIHDDSVRPKHDSSHTEQDVFTWLESKAPNSVIYISFGSVNSPGDDELTEIASALVKSNYFFIWAVQSNTMKHDTTTGRPVLDHRPGSFDPSVLAKQVGDRGLVIRGWAPQLMILNHKSVGGFLTHCGWNSTVEALGCGVPMLTWPIHGDQVYNARLVTEWLKTGHVLKHEGKYERINSEQVLEGMEKLMRDEETRNNAVSVAEKMFGKGFPSSSESALDAFLDLIDDTRRNQNK